MIPEHSHCHICGRTVAVGVELCDSADCKEKKEEALAMKKRGVWMIIGVIVAAVLLTKII